MLIIIFIYNLYLDLKHTVAGQNISINLEHHEKSCFTLLNKHKFERIILNYISNALKFTPPKGAITFFAK